MSNVTEYDAWLHCEVLTGLEAANAGDVLTADAVEPEADAWRADVHRRNAEGRQPDRHEGRGPYRKK